MNRGSQDLAWVSSTMVESTGSKAFHTVFNAAWSLLQHPTVDVGVDDGRDPEREEIEEWYDWKRITQENMAIRGVCKATQQKQWFVSARLEIMRTMDWFRTLDAWYMDQQQRLAEEIYRGQARSSHRWLYAREMAQRMSKR